MKKIHLIKANQALPMVMALQKSGARIERIAEQSKLPLDTVRNSSGVIGEYSLWQFMETGARQEGYDFLGFDAARLNPITTLGEIGGMRLQLAPTLERILHHFIEFAKAESVTSDHKLVPTEDGIWFRRAPIFTGDQASWQVEQYFIELIIQIVRICAGENWLPHTVAMCSADKALRLPPEWTGIKTIWGNKTTDIHIPTEVLTLPPNIILRMPDTELTNVFGSQRDAAKFSDFVGTQILGGITGLDSAAEELGNSVSTLKRRLHDEGLSYSEVVTQVRLEIARHELAESDTAISDIATKLGYEYQANFTRAFKRFAGMSPKEYRDLWKI